MRERLVLRILVGQIIRALKLDADGEIIAHGPALVFGFTRVPGARLKGHVLHDAAIAPDERMRRDALPRDVAKEGMRIRIQSAGKEPIDPRSAELARRQADAVDDDEVGTVSCGRASKCGDSTCLARASSPVDRSICMPQIMPQ
jgi:hypothetical protein